MTQPETDCPSMELPLVAPLQKERPATTSESPQPTPTLLSKVEPIPQTDSARRILGIDIENKPLWYGGGDFVYDSVICVTPKWVGAPDTEAEPIWLDWSHKDGTLVRQLGPLREMIEECDALLGHNFKHDWRGLQSVFNHLKQPFLPKRPIVDTMRCIPSGMPRGLEWLCDLFELGEKPHVPARTWIAAIERREPWAVLKVKERNVADVILTERLYEKERELGWLTPRITKPMKTAMM
jgi:hypothetical protein